MSNHDQPWRDRLEEQARMLEWQAAVARLLAMAETPNDAIDVAGDLVRAGKHVDAARNARARGHHVPAPPAPISNLLVGFAGALRAKLLAVGDELLPAERDRLLELGPRVLAALEAQDEDVVTLVGQLVPLPPAGIAWWIRAHLDIIERRFSS